MILIETVLLTTTFGTLYLFLLDESGSGVACRDQRRAGCSGNIDSKKIAVANGRKEGRIDR